MSSPPRSPVTSHVGRHSTASLQRKTSFVSTLRTLPSQRASMMLGGSAPATAESGSPVLGQMGPAASGFFSDDGAGPPSQRFAMNGSMDTPSAPPSFSRAGGTEWPTEDKQNSASRRGTTAMTSETTSAATRVDPMSRQSTEGAGSPTVSNKRGISTPPLSDYIQPQPSLKTDEGRRLQRGDYTPVVLPTTWKSLFVTWAQLSEDTATKYSDMFDVHEMPAPTRVDILMYGVDHEILQSIGVRSAGHRAMIISACRALASRFAARCRAQQAVGEGPSSPGGTLGSYTAFPVSGTDAAGGHGDGGGHPHVHFLPPSGHHRTHSSETARSEEVTGQRRLPCIYRAMSGHGSAEYFDEAGDDGRSRHGMLSALGDEVVSEVGSAAGDALTEQGMYRQHVSGADLRQPLLNCSDGPQPISYHAASSKRSLMDGPESTVSPRERHNTLSSISQPNLGSGAGRGGSQGAAVVAYREGLQRNTSNDVTFVYDDATVHQFEFRSWGKHPYVWVDVVGRDPRRMAFRDHLRRIAQTYDFAESLLLDIDLTLALPQLISCPSEPDQFLVILRVAAASSGGIEEDSLHLLTNRVMIAVNLKNRTVVTIHRRDTMHLAQLREAWFSIHGASSMTQLMCQMLEDSLLSYVDAIHDSESLQDEYEALMLKHSVGATSNTSQSSSARNRNSSNGPQVRFFSNGSFAAELQSGSPSWRDRFSRILDCFGFGKPDTNTRNRSSTAMAGVGGSFATPLMVGGDTNSLSGLRLRNKEYQEDMLGSDSFSRQRMNQLLYHLHRRCSVYNRMLTLTQTTLEASYNTLRLATPEYAEQVGRSCGELAMKADSLHDNCQNLLNLHLSLVSFRTNELMNLLTVYSAVFIPITFICSVYGMNFENMPELSWRNGYYYCLGVMGFMVIGVLTWFRRKGFI